MSDRQSHARLLAQLDAARRRLDRDTNLLNWALTLHAKMQWGVCDLDDLAEEVRAFKSAVRASGR
jgi:hypothetical protein